MSKKKDTLHIYVRCSNDNQIENSISRQKEMGIKFSKDMNMSNKVWSDEGKSGIKSYEDTREQLVNLLWEVELGTVKHIWCEDFTRLTRNFEDQVKIEKLIMDNDLFVYEGLTNNQIYQPNDLSQRLIKVVTSMVGTDQKKNEIKKSIKQKIIKFKQGYYVRGNISYGFDKVDGYLVKNKEESKWVKKMFEWYLEGDSLVKIMKKCKVNGLKSKRGNDWSSEGVRILLSNPEYTGKTYYTDMTKDPHRRNPQKYPYPDETKWEVHMNDNLPRIISDDLWNKVQKKLNVYRTHTTEHIYFLHGKIKCVCGCDWIGRSKSRKDRNQPPEFYYICNNTDRWYHRKRPNRTHLHQKNICDKPKRLNTSDLDNLVWDELLKSLRNSSFIKERVKMDLLGGKYDTTSSRRMVNKELKRIRKEIKSLENSRVQLLKEKYVLELSDTDFNEINSSIITKMSELKNELRKQTDKELLLDKRSDWIDWVGKHHKDVNDYMKVTDTKTKRRILDIFVNKVRVNYLKETQQHIIEIHFKYPLVNDGIEYKTKKDSKIKWDKWGKPYRIKKGDQVVSLSSLDSKPLGVDFNYSTVTNLLESTPIPYLTFILRIVSHEFVHRKELSNSHQKLHNTISELKEQGLGYRKISKELNRLGIKSKEGKDFYPTLVSGIWKKIVKKQRILNQPITSEYKDFDIQFFLRNE